VSRLPARGGVTLAGIDWEAARCDLDTIGVARLPGVLSAGECADLAALFDDDRHFRKTVEMDRLRFGSGVYRYFASPLPPVVQALRGGAYPPLAAIANDWQKALRRRTRFPKTLARFLAQCRRAGQRKPTPLVLRYVAGGYNRMHQDLYGDLAFPLQMTFLLSRPGSGFTGGEMLFLETRPREQSIGNAVAPEQGDGVVFAVNDRPVRGARGFRRATLRHGVSRITSGLRLTLGVIFHDAR
jgi:hypothetical protein